MATPAPSPLADALMTLAAHKVLDKVVLQQAYDYAVLQDKCIADQEALIENLELEATLLRAMPRVEGLDLAPFAEECHANAVAHGWHDETRTFGDNIALMHSELSEALEAFRLPLPWNAKLFHLVPEFQADPSQPQKPEGILSELADVVIRILDYTESIHATEKLVEVLKLKHAYNKSRPFRHGGKAL